MVYKLEFTQERRLSTIERLNEEQRGYWNRLTLLQQDVCIGVLGGKTWRQSFEESTFETQSNPKSACTNMQNNFYVQMFLKSVREEEIDERIMQRDEALRILSRQARGKLSDVVELTDEFTGMCPEGGGPIWRTRFGLKKATEIDPELFANIMEISHVQAGVKVKQYSQKEAIQTLAKMQGWDSAGPPLKHELTGLNGEPIVTRSLEKSEYAKVRMQMLSSDNV